MKQIILSGEWELEQKGKGIAIPATIPGDNISALLSAGCIKEPFQEQNEKELQWIGDETWIFRKSFEADIAFISMAHLFLNLEMVDTMAVVYLNRREVGCCSNMFLRYRFDITGLLEEGENLLEIVISPAEKEAFRLQERLPYPIPHTIHPIQSGGRNLVRKAQCHGGWDWGPCLMVSGIYGEVSLSGSPLERIESVHTNMKLLDGKNNWEVEVVSELFSPLEGAGKLDINCAGAALTIPIVLKPGLNQFVNTLTVSDPLLWWPAAYGEQILYQLEVFTDNDSLRKEIGFRDVKVITASDSDGIPMTFRINGKDIFCKGANWIPSDALPGRYSEERYRKLLEAAVNANMNMIRVWGGGHYESDVFYRLCDKLGLLVWQDFMFACALYPSEPWFLKNVEKEAEYQIKRLKDHPSLILWCGNNEDLGALTWFEASRKQRDRYLVDYDRLNEGVLGKAVKTLDPLRQWWPSSPSAGEGDYSDCWHNDSKGDMHYWSVWHEGAPFESYRSVIPRFCSEFGFQSFPSLELIKSFCPEDQLNISSPVMEHHQRNPRGNSIIVSTMTRYFRFPQSFERMIYQSQVQQAMAITTAVEYWRSCRPRCMGSLYWQLNDNWPAVSWSSIEYGGAWKLLHYAARRFYAPLLLVIQGGERDEITFHGINDTGKAIMGSLQISCISFDGQVLSKKQIDAIIKEEAATHLFSMNTDIQGDHLPDKTQWFIHAKFLPENSDQEAFENSLLLLPPKQCGIKAARISITPVPDCRREIEISADRPAFWVTLSIRGCKAPFSDNAFHLAGGEKRRISLPDDLPEKGDLMEMIEITQLGE